MKRIFVTLIALSLSAILPACGTPGPETTPSASTNQDVSSGQIEDSSQDTDRNHESASSGQTKAENLLTPFIGNWVDEAGSGAFLSVDYGDESQTWAKAHVSTAAADFEVDLYSEDGSLASGTVMSGGSEPLYALELSRYKYWLESLIYYGETGEEESIKFVPADTTISEPGTAELSITAPFVGSWMDENGYGLYLFVGYEDESQARILAHLSTAAADFEVELHSEDGITASGSVMAEGSEPLYALDLTRYQYWLDALVYYGELGEEEYIKFLPADPLTCPYENPYYVG